MRSISRDRGSEMRWQIGLSSSLKEKESRKNENKKERKFKRLRWMEGEERQKRRGGGGGGTGGGEESGTRTKITERHFNE